MLAQEGLAARVINCSCLKPLDWELLVDSARRTGAVVTAEEHMVTGGLGSAVSEILGEHYPVPLTRVGLKDTFGTSGKPEELLRHYGLTAEDITMAARQVCRRKMANRGAPGGHLQPAAALRGKS